MAGTKLTPQQQRDRRAKIMLAVLGAVLLGVVALQIPKFLKGSSGGPTPVAAPAVTTTPTALASAPATGQLARFSRFAPKDPFRAKVSLATTTPGASTTPATTTPSAPAKPKPPKQPKQQPSPITINVKQQQLPPAGPRVPAALLTINGKKQVVPLDGSYPAAHPVFKVVALSGKALWIQLIGGSLANGSQTVKLDVGRRVTLENATAGLKIVLELIKPTTAPKPIALPALPPSTTTAATTTTQATTTTSG